MLFAAFMLLKNFSQAAVDLLLSLASKIKDPRVAIPVYKEVIAVFPHQLDAYTALCSFLKDPEERSCLLKKAAGFAERAGKPVLGSEVPQRGPHPCLSLIDDPRG